MTMPHQSVERVDLPAFTEDGDMSFSFELIEGFGRGRVFVQRF